MRRELAEKDQLIAQLRRRIAELEGNGAKRNERNASMVDVVLYR
jgi:hypothetical protein